MNRIASARLAFLDGAASAGDFPLSNGPLLIPGKEIEILAGTTSSPLRLFKGLIVRQLLKIRDQSAPQLIVECRHHAAKLTVGRHSAVFVNRKDSDVITSLLSASGLTGDVEETSVTHDQLVQYATTDWDFLLARAEANGKVVLTKADTVVVKAPDLASAPVCTLQFGESILELDAEIDSRLQFGSVKSITWDPADQRVIEREATETGSIGPGNLTSEDLAKVVGIASFDLRHASLSEPEAQAWADAQWLASKVGRVNGKVKCEGIATIEPGGRVTLGGIGDRYSGDAYVAGLRHEFDLIRGWKTHVQFGGVQRPAASDQATLAPLAGGLVPGVGGLQIGVVTGNEDPAGEHRVRVRLPLVDPADDGIWARVASVDAGSQRGFFIRPDLGDEVAVGFLDGDPRRALIIGMLHSSAHPAPLSGSDDNHEKVYQSRSQMRIYLNDETKTLRLETPAGNSVVLDEAAHGISINDENGNKIALTPEGITIESATALVVKGGTELTVESGSSLTARSGSALTLEGAGGAELTSTATTRLRGSLVQIN